MIYLYILKIFKKKLSIRKNFSGGKNIHGRITVRGRGGANKRIYKFIDFFRRINTVGRIIKFIYDPNRTAKLAFIIYMNSLCSFILLQKNVEFNEDIYSGSTLYEEDIIRPGFSMPLKYMPLFSNISNIELKPFIGGSLCRAASTSCILVGKVNNTNKGILKLNSKWELHLSLDCISSFGSIANKYVNNIFIEKAGKNRAFGWKPKVRGVAKNPCDHPHGGGNGKRSKPKVPVNAWHTVFKWRPTTNTKMDNLKRRKFKKY